MTLLCDENYPPLNLKTDEEIMDYIDEHQVAGLNAQGYKWFWSIYMPALERVAEANLVDNETIAGNFYAVGDVHDFNQSPSVAISYYKRALDFDPELNAAHREIAQMYHRLGFIDAAIHHSDLALALWPDEKSALEDRVYIDEDKNDPIPYYERNDTPSARARDALARNNAAQAIKLLEGLDDTESLRTLTWAYGANGDKAEYLLTWETLLVRTQVITSHSNASGLSEDEIWITLADLFFMPHEIWSGPEIWGLWMNFGDVCVSVGVYEGLDDDECDLPTDNNFTKLTLAEQTAQKIEYCFHDRSDNLEGLKSIQTKYPNWKDLNASIEVLETKMPIM